MRNIGYLSILLATFLVGVVVTNFFREAPRRDSVTTAELASDTPPLFIATGSSLESGYQIYRYRTPVSSDPEEITLYGDFRSAEVTRETFESNATTDAATLIERGNKFDENGRRIGQRVVTVFKRTNQFRISWTEGDVFWSVQAPSLELAREFEESQIVHLITMSNKSLHRGAGQRASQP
jgi:hypothetical protein